MKKLILVTILLASFNLIVSASDTFKVGVSIPLCYEHANTGTISAIRSLNYKAKQVCDYPLLQDVRFNITTTEQAGGTCGNIKADAIYSCK